MINLLIVQKWNSLEHGLTGSIYLDNFIKDKFLLICSLDDEKESFHNNINYSYIKNGIVRKNEINAYRNLHHIASLLNYSLENSVKLVIGRIFYVSIRNIKYTLVFDKTYLIINLQKKWKKYYSKLKKKIQKYKNPHNLLYRKLGIQI